MQGFKEPQTTKELFEMIAKARKGQLDAQGLNYLWEVYKAVIVIMAQPEASNETTDRSQMALFS